jgi:signal transduction histidine kinase
MKNNTFSNLIWTSVIKSWGGVLTILSFLAILISYFVVPQQDVVAMKWLVIMGFISLFLIIVFARAAWEAYSNQVIHIPKVMHVKDAPKAFSTACALFLVEPTPLLSYDAIVSIYYLEDEVERLVGVGKVINIQNDLKVQVLVLRNYDFDEKLEVIMKNSKDELKKLIIKSSIPSFFIDGGIQE